MLLELAIGDAVGATFEYAPDEYVSANNTGDRYYSRQRPMGSFTPKGRYTDDTQMSLAIAEHILSGEEWTKPALAERFVSCFKRDERVGYARHFYYLLKEVKTGVELLEKIKPDSDKSGGAMRAPLIGIYPTIKEVKEKAALQASITHNTPLGIQAAQASALSLHYFAHDLGPKANLLNFIASNVDGHAWDMPYVGNVGAKGWMSVRAALTAIVNGNDMTSILKASIAFTGDVDTVAAIALAAGSVSREVEQNLAYELHQGLERGKYGYDYIKSLDDHLSEMLAINSIRV